MRRLLTVGFYEHTSALFLMSETLKVGDLVENETTQITCRAKAVNRGMGSIQKQTTFQRGRLMNHKYVVICFIYIEKIIKGEQTSFYFFLLFFVCLSRDYEVLRMDTVVISPLFLFYFIYSTLRLSYAKLTLAKGF